MRILNKTSRLGLAVLLAFGMAGVAQAQECVYDGWDMTSDGLLDQAEFRAGFDNEEWFDEWDDDDDELLSESEFDVGTSDWGMARTGLWADWDANEDDFIDDDEFAEGLFDVWDEDDDVMLSCDEYNAGLGWFE
jgi:hypothetical protein